jgi:hypothetical protein
LGFQLFGYFLEFGAWALGFPHAAQLNGWTIGSNRGSVDIPMKRELKPTEHEAVLNAVMAGDRVKATSIYLSATEGNLTDAQKFVKRLAVELKEQRAGAEGSPSR